MFSEFSIFINILILLTIVCTSVVSTTIENVLDSIKINQGGINFEKQMKILQIAQIWQRRQLSHNSLNMRKTWDKSYDYIVVGAGTAGSVVAARLAEDVSKKIVLIEVGGPQSVKSDIPALQEQLIGSNLDWKYQIQPQMKAFQAFIGNTRNLSRGKAFGGCSMHNGMNYYRENPEFFYYWTELAGVEGWTWNDVLPYFKKTENNLDENIVNNGSDHIRGGLMSITTAISDAILKAYIDASPGLGYPITYTDGRQPFGSTIMQRNILDGVRQSTSLVFLERNRKSNLHILGETLVSKILFNENKRAIGVQFYRKGKQYTVSATKEIIICGGVIGSPQLLMLSGIGPRIHLQEKEIPVISDLNVGQLLHSPYVSLNFDLKDQSSVEKPIENIDNYYKYFVEMRGPLAYKASGITCFHDIPFHDHPNISNGLTLPRIGLLGTDLEELVRDYNLKDEWKEYYRPYLNRTYFSAVSVLKHPQSRGTIRLSSTNPFVYPVIDPCYFCVEQDFNDLVKVFKKTMEFFMSPAMSSVVQLYKKPIPGCSPCPHQYFCDSYINCIIRSITGVVYPTSSCPMGRAGDSNAVVDQRLRVFGVSGLRVIDSSVMPFGSEQSSAITVMIGEYGAHLIKEDNT